MIMTLPHFPIQGQSCFQDEQPGHGEPLHEKSTGDSASHRDIERKGQWLTLQKVLETYMYPAVGHLISTSL